MHMYVFSKNQSLIIFFILYVVAVQFSTGCENIPQEAEIKEYSVSSEKIQMIDSIISFNNILEGDKITVHFRFKNIGNKPLLIKDILTDCGCTVAEKPDYPVNPNKIDSIKIKFNSTGKVGSIYKEISIHSNDDRCPYTKIYLTGTVANRYN